MAESRAGELADKVDMQIRLAAYRVLRAITLRRQAQTAVAASTILSIVSAARPESLSPDLTAITGILQVSAIRDFLKETARKPDQDDEALAAEAEQRLQLAEVDQLLTGQHDLLRAVTRQFTWQQQMLRLQEEDAQAGARLLAAFAEMTGDLAAIRDALGAVATAAQVNALLALIRDKVLPQLSEAIRERYVLSGDFRGAIVNINSPVTIAWPPGPPYTPPPHPAPGELPAPGPLPRGSFLVYDRNPLFTGREEQLLDLSGLLRPDRSDPSPVVISSGIGGVGKTQLAVEFAYRYGRFFHGVHWVSAENPDAIDAAIAECGRRMGLHPTFGHLPLPDQVALTERAWAEPEARLVIFDNCEEPRALARRPKGGGARLLVTSRRERWDGELGGAVRPVRPLPSDDSVRLLRRHLTEGEGRPPRGDIGDDDLRPIAAELGELPLALRLAGAYLRLYKRETAADYLAALRRPDVLAHPSLRQAGQSAGGHVPDVGRTFAVSFDKLRPDNPTDAAALSLLACAACFAPGEPLPEALLLAAGEEAAAGRGQPPAARVLDDGLERLLALGLLEGAGGADAVRLHRLLAAFAAKALAPVIVRTFKAVSEATADLAERAKEMGNLWVVSSWISQLRHITDKQLAREERTSARLCNVLANWLQVTGDLTTSVRYTDWALNICQTQLSEEDLVYTETLNNKGFLLRAQGDLAGARPYLERALAVRERVLGPDHPDTATSLNNLGFLLQAQGDLAGARPYYERALAIRERVLGPDHPATATSLNNLGLLLRAQGDLAGARPYYERALAIRERVLGPDHPATAGSLNNLGALLDSMGDLAGARPYYERALAILERVLGPDHPDTATSLNNLGFLLQAQGDLAGARPYYERALAIRERVLGPDHPATAGSLTNLGALLQAQGDLAGARPYLERALAIWERVLGPDHPDTATSLNNLGFLLRAQGDLAGARPTYERALAIRERVLGPDHPDTAGSLNNLGYLLQAQGDLAEARPYYERALAIRERVLGPDHPDTALSLNNLGGLLQAQGDLAGARPTYERALAIRERVLGPDHPDTAQSLWWMGVLAQTDGNREEAREYYRRAQVIYLKVLGPDHATTRGVTGFLERLG